MTPRQDNRRSPAYDPRRVRAEREIDRLRAKVHTLPRSGVHVVPVDDMRSTDIPILLDYIDALTADLAVMSAAYDDAEADLRKAEAERDALLTVVQHLRLMSALGLPLPDNSPSPVEGGQS